MILSELIKNNQITKNKIKNATVEELNFQNEQGFDSPLHLAIKFGTLDIVSAFIKNGKCNLNIKDANNWTALHTALFNGKLEIANMLISNKKFTAINDYNNKNIFPLVYALEKDYKSVVMTLLQRLDININIINKNGFTPLHLAVKTNHFEAVNLIVNKWKIMDINNTNNGEGLAPLHIAVKRENISIIKVLMKYSNININCQSVKIKVTPLKIAVDTNNFEIVNLLVTSGANVNLEDAGKISPLRMAVENEKEKICKYLLENGANPNSQDMCGITPLHAAAAGKNFKIFKLLVDDKNCDIHIKDIRGSSALVWTFQNLDKKLGVSYVNYMLVESKLRSKEVQKIGLIKMHNDAQYNAFQIRTYFKYSALLNNPAAAKIFNSFNNDDYLKHYQVVNEYINKYQLIYEKVHESSWEASKKIEDELFFKSLKEYQLDFERFNLILSTSNNLLLELEKKQENEEKLMQYQEQSQIWKESKLEAEQIKIEKEAVSQNVLCCANDDIKEKNFQLGLQKLKEFKENENASKKSVNEQQVYHLTPVEEKRIYPPKVPKIPKGQQSKARHIDWPKQKTPQQKINSNKSTKSKIEIVSYQPNIAQIDKERKIIAKQECISNRKQLMSKPNASSLINFFPDLQESFAGLNKDEFNTEIKWWNDKVNNLQLDDSEVLLKFGHQIKEKITNINIKERKLNLEQLTILQLAKENQDAELAAIINVNRGELWDHKYGRPAISLGKTIDNGKELVIVGTTREIKGLPCFTLNLVEDKTTYFYFKNIVTIEKEDNKGWWDKQNKPTLTENEIATLFAQIDDYNEKNANFQHQVNNVSPKIAKQWDATGAKPKSKFEIDDVPKLFPQKELLSNEPQARTSFDRSIIFNLEAETAKVAEQMLAQQAKEKQARERSQQEKAESARGKKQKEPLLFN
ncbi:MULTISPECIES: ankyrin repeat domain-containing protein [unclassified Spiroplasma]|uniref:ankyrin repeat domain-containing protein n=1 Tax=unclassified Spiroplasma TaxID=2637901 RepID=UPI00313E9B81